MRKKGLCFFCLLTVFFSFSSFAKDKVLQQRISSYEREIDEREKSHQKQIEEYELQIKLKNSTIEKLESEIKIEENKRNELIEQQKKDFESFKIKQQEKYNSEIEKKTIELNKEYEDKYSSSVKKFIEAEKKIISKEIQEKTLLLPKIIIIILVFILTLTLLMLRIYSLIKRKKEEALYNEIYKKLEEKQFIDIDKMSKSSKSIYEKTKEDYYKAKKIEKMYENIKYEEKGIEKMFSTIENIKNDKETIFYLLSGFLDKANKIKTKCNAICKETYPLSTRMNLFVTKTFYNKVSDEIYGYRDQILKLDIEKDTRLNNEIQNIVEKYKEIAEEIKSYGRVK